MIELTVGFVLGLLFSWRRPRFSNAYFSSQVMGRGFLKSVKDGARAFLGMKSLV